MLADPLHLARLALLEGAMRSLLAEAADNPLRSPGEPPLCDEITATLDDTGLNISYLRGGNPVAGEGM